MNQNNPKRKMKSQDNVKLRLNTKIKKNIQTIIQNQAKKVWLVREKVKLKSIKYILKG